MGSQLGGLEAEPRRPAPRRAVVLGQQRDDLVGAVAGALLDEAADLEVLPRPHRLGQHLVGHVADQHVLERELGLARQRVPSPGHDDVLLAQRGQGASQVAALRVGHRRQRVLPERPSHHRRVLHEPALEAARASPAAPPAGPARCRAARSRPTCPPRPAAAPSPRRTAGCRPRARPPWARARACPRRPAAARRSGRASRSA